MSCPPELRAIELGRFARRVLRQPATVIARFERSVYVANDAGLACIGGPGLGSGPLNAIVAEPLRLPALGNSICILISCAHAWTPEPAPRLVAGKLVRSLATREILDAVAGRGLFPVRNRHPGIVAMRQWIADGVRGRAPLDAAALVGMGPGLTPAGDDLIGGALVALRSVRRHALASRLAAWAVRLARTRTNRISRAHLACAATGEGGEALHAFINALLAGERDPARAIAALDALDAVGHTSGWDAAAGAAVVLETSTFSPPRRRCAHSPAQASPRARRSGARPA